MAEEIALVDSGATENFINQETIKKQKLRDNGAYFKCWQKGHILRYCPTRQNGSAEYGRPAPTQQSCLGITNAAEEPKKKEPKGIKDLLKIAKGYLTN